MIKVTSKGIFFMPIRLSNCRANASHRVTISKHLAFNYPQKGDRGVCLPQ